MIPLAFVPAAVAYICWPWIKAWFTKRKPAGEVLTKLRGAGYSDDQIRRMTIEERVRAYRAASQ